MDLLGSLSSASRALQAQRLGMDVVGQNIANVNTPGYCRRDLDLASIAPTDNLSAGGGVQVVGIRASRDVLLERRLRQESPMQQREGVIADSLSVVEAVLGRAGDSIDAELAAFFDAFSRLAETPVSSVARQEVLLQGGTLSRAVRDMSERLRTAVGETNAQMESEIERVTALVSQVANLNDAIAQSSSTPAATLALKDQQGEALRKLAELVDVDVAERSDGGVDVSFANGRALVIGANAYQIEAVPQPPDGLLALKSGDIDVTAEITGGRIGGLLQVRDVLLPGYRDRLDSLAYTLVEQVNTLHEDGFDLDGAPGVAFFTPLAGVAGAAAAMALNPALAADPRLLAAAGTPAAGDNQAARAIALLRDTPVLDNHTATLSDGWAQLVYRVGQDAASARLEQRGRAEVVLQLEALRDAISGVSLDEEAMALLKFQRAYEANARFFRSIDEAIGTLMQMLGS